MREIQKIFILIFVLFGIFFVHGAVVAQEPAQVFFFWGDGCPHCAKEELFLEEAQETYGDLLQVYSYEVWYNEENQALLEQYAEERGEQIQGVPTTFIGDDMVVGFGSVETTGAEIKNLIDQALANNSEKGEQIEAETVTIPLLGVVNPKNYSLSVITFLIAAVDGFNPCAMWVLILLIGMLIGMKSRKRLWILGTLFIFVSGAVYFVFLAAWFNVFYIIGALRWIQVIVGIFAFGAGVFYIRRYWKTRPGQCEVTNPEQKRKISDRMKTVLHQRSLLFACLGIIVLAVLVNAIELVCSAGLPAIYTQVLSLNDLATWQYYAYLAFYIFIFMLDDLIIFAIAVTTFRSIASTGKYTHIATLIGGVVILFLGFALLFAPELIMF